MLLGDRPERCCGDAIDGAPDLVLPVDRMSGTKLARGEEHLADVEFAAQQVTQAGSAGMHEVEEVGPVGGLPVEPPHTVPGSVRIW